MIIHTTKAPRHFYLIPNFKWDNQKIRSWCERINSTLEERKKEKRDWWYEILENPTYPNRLPDFVAIFGDPEKAFEELWATNDFWLGVDWSNTAAGRWLEKFILRDLYDQIEIHPLSDENLLHGFFTKREFVHNPTPIPIRRFKK